MKENILKEAYKKLEITNSEINLMRNEINFLRVEIVTAVEKEQKTRKMLLEGIWVLFIANSDWEERLSQLQNSVSKEKEESFKELLNEKYIAEIEVDVNIFYYKRG